jgi:hypothetical protein
MDYHDHFAVEREARRLRREEIRRLEIAAIGWMEGRFHAMRERLAAALHQPLLPHHARLLFTAGRGRGPSGPRGR